MSQVDPGKYRYLVCPVCRSKDLRPVGVYDFRNDENYATTSSIWKTGYICGNCGRYHISRKMKWATDRAEMRRDIARLQAFLADK